MKVIIVRLLLPPLTEPQSNITSPITQAAQTQSNLAVQDREEAAIQVHVSTMAPQTPYSTPQVVWRPDGAGVFVNGDDGLIRGLEAKTGKIVATLQGGHEVGSKIRSIWVCISKSSFFFYSYHSLSRKTCCGSENCHMPIRAVSLLAPISRRRNSDSKISIVWAYPSRGRKGGVACKWRI